MALTQPCCFPEEPQIVLWTLILPNPVVHNVNAVVSGFIPLIWDDNDTHNTNEQMIIKTFIYGFEIMLLHQLYPPNYVLLEIPRGYICRWKLYISGCVRVEETTA